MDHIVYLDARSNELEQLLQGKKTMIIRGATGRKIPYGRIHVNDVLYFIRNNAEGTIKAKGVVSTVLQSEKMTEDESKTFVRNHQDALQLTEKQFQRWAGKRYIVLITIKDVTEIDPFTIDKSDFSTMDDWLLVENIETVRTR
ncbi:MAG: hypothetical protein V1769_00120 [Thermoplasmatota archaeon]